MPAEAATADAGTSRPVRLAVSLSHLDPFASAPGQADLLRLAVAAESAGVDQLVLSEHVALPDRVTDHPGARPGDPPVPFPFPPDEEYPDPLVALAAVAAVTSRVRLGTNILVATLRPPVLLAKMAATVDVLSRGRLDLGVGVGWQRDELAALGVPRGHLGRRLEDTIGACRALWRGGPATFASDTVSFRDLHCSPTPVQPGGVPVWFGGSARPSVAARVARLGHGWSPIGNTPPADVAAGVALVRDHCEQVGRDPGKIDVRCSLPLVRRGDGTADVEATVGRADDYVAAGATVVQFPALAAFVTRHDEVPGVLEAAVAALQRRVAS